jgi:hypothetical protein
MDDFPYSAGILIGNLNVRDSSLSTNETRLDLNVQTGLTLASLPIQAKFRWISATGGLSLMDISGGIQNYQFAGMLFEGSLHFYWAQGMAGQNLVRLRPHLMASYQVTTRHRIYAYYRPMFVPMTLSSNIRVNRILSTASVVRHEDVINAGEVGVESDWSDAIRSHISFNVQSVRDLTVFSDSSRQGIWITAYGGQTMVVTFCGEMVAKLKSNDYFASTIILRSTKDSYRNKVIPYVPTVEGSCSAYHKFGRTTAARIHLRFAGERKADLIEIVTLPQYVVVDISGEYTPFDFLRFTVGIKNLTGMRYEIWRGYQEFPMTMHVSLQIKW